MSPAGVDRILLASALLIVGLVIAACGSGGDTAEGLARSEAADGGTPSSGGADGDEPDGSGGAGDESDGPTGADGGQTDGGQTDGEVIDGEVTDSEVTDSEVIVVDDVDRLPTDPEVGPLPGPLLAFGPAGIRRIAVDGAVQVVAPDDAVEVADDGAGGVVFQRAGEDSIIRWLAAGRTEAADLLVTDIGPEKAIRLEGVVGQGADRRVVYQRYDNTGQPETTLSTLRAYRFRDQSVDELLVTGGWESGSSFSGLTDTRAVQEWGGEGFIAYAVIDLTSGDALYDTLADSGLECFDGFGECPDFTVTTPDGDDILGVGPVWNESAGVIDRFALSRFDTDTLSIDPIAAIPWDNDTWYPEHLFVRDGVAVISRATGPVFWPGSDTDPLPALAVDLATGRTWVVPVEGHLRPAPA